MDIVNHRLKIAIEIKDLISEEGIIPDNHTKVKTLSRDLNKASSRFWDLIRSSWKNFKNYPKYRTILIVRTRYLLIPTFFSLLKGPVIFIIDKQSLRVKRISIIRKTKYNPIILKEIGCFIRFNGNRNVYYINNSIASHDRVLYKNDIEIIFKMNFEIPQKNIK